MKRIIVLAFTFLIVIGCSAQPQIQPTPDIAAMIKLSVEATVTAMNKVAPSPIGACERFADLKVRRAKGILSDVEVREGAKAIYEASHGSDLETAAERLLHAATVRNESFYSTAEYDFGYLCE